MAKKELNQKGASTISNIGVKQGSWYFPLMLLFATICAAGLALVIGGMIDILKLSLGLTTILVLVLTAILVVYIVLIVKIIMEWCKNTTAVTDQEVAKKQILFLEAYRRAKELKPSAV